MPRTKLPLSTSQTDSVKELTLPMEPTSKKLGVGAEIMGKIEKKEEGFLEKYRAEGRTERRLTKKLTSPKLTAEAARRQRKPEDLRVSRSELVILRPRSGTIPAQSLPKSPDLKRRSCKVDSTIVDRDK